MNEDEKLLVGALLKYTAKFLCRSVPAEDIQNLPYPYPPAQMQARVGAKYCIHCSAHGYAETLLFERMNFVDHLGYRQYAMLVDSDDIPSLVFTRKILPANLLDEAFWSYHDLVTQNHNWLVYLESYDEVMKLFETCGFARFGQLDLQKLKFWYEEFQRAINSVHHPASRVVKSGPNVELWKLWQRKGNEHKILMFDREHGTSGAKVWRWTDKMKSYYEEATGEAFEPWATGGKYM
ncbi:MAG: hypothetical protein GY742_14655 [Hyphomicrobiales bacterium]|nr:hypothetical protein [Hyphomicrobiales bacterium]